jgi:hypothetical protein
MQWEVVYPRCRVQALRGIPIGREAKDRRFSVHESAEGEGEEESDELGRQRKRERRELIPTLIPHSIFS